MRSNWTWLYYFFQSNHAALTPLEDMSAGRGQAGGGPPQNCQKVFIQRDYSEGTMVKFQTRFPTELESRVSIWDESNILISINRDLTKFRKSGKRWPRNIYYGVSLDLAGQTVVRVHDQSIEQLFCGSGACQLFHLLRELPILSHGLSDKHMYRDALWEMSA